MVQYMSDGGIAGFYNTVAAATTAQQKLSATQGGSTGTVGDYLESLVVTAGAATTGTVTLNDGNVTILTFTPTANTTTYFPLRVYAKVTTTPGWSVASGAAATTSSVIAVGKFS